MLDNDINNVPFDWIDSVHRELAVLINAGLDERAQIFMSNKGIVGLLETCVKSLLISKSTDTKDVI